jgi:hypothetical protein
MLGHGGAHGDSGPTYSRADVITDFNTDYDSIAVPWVRIGSSGPIFGTDAKYREYAFTGDGTYSGTYAQALEYAQEDIGGSVNFAFYTDGQDGYLFADLDDNGTVETGIELRGLNSTRDFHYWDIIN